MTGFPPKKPRIVKPRPVTEERLYNSAVYYLQRYSATAAHLATILQRKVKRWTKEQSDFAVGADEKITKVVERIVALGYINDAVFAESRTRSLRRQGKSESTIRQHLRQKGVQDEILMTEAIQKGNEDFISEVTPGLRPDDEDEDNLRREAELQALQRLIKRKRLLQSNDPEQRQKDIAKILRAGFGWDLVRKITSE